MKQKVLIILLCLVVIAFCSCAKKAPPPSEVFQSTMRSLATGNANDAWENISTSSRARFHSKDQFTAILAGTLATTDVKSTIEAIEIINESIENGKALLTIQYPCPESEDGLKKRDIECVREGNAWKINISELVDDIMDA